MMGWFKKKEAVEKPKVEVSVKGSIKFKSVEEGWDSYTLVFVPDLDITYIQNGRSETFKRVNTMSIPLGKHIYTIEKVYREAFELIYDFIHQKEGNAVMKKIKGAIEYDVVNHIENMEESELAKRITDIAPQSIDISFKFEL